MGSAPERLVGVPEASARLSRALSALQIGVEEVGVLEAAGRALAEDLLALLDNPPFDRSAVDGFAVRSADTVGASPYAPAELKVVGAGGPLGPGEAAPVSTGDPLPPGADAVVMAEEAELAGERVLVLRPVAAGANVSRRGEDVSRGQLIAERGRLLLARDIPALLAAGIARVKVLRKVRVAVLAVGSELREPGAGEGIVNTTAHLAEAYLRGLGLLEVRYLGIYEDDPKVVEEALQSSAEGHDVLVTTGGTGPGARDVLPAAVERAGAWLFRGVRMRPGRPTSASLIGGKPALHLSGLPLAAWAALEAIFKPALARGLGVKGLEPLAVPARMARRVPNEAGYRTYLRVLLRPEGGSLVAEPAPARGSGLTSVLSKTNGYVVIEEGCEGYEEGELVEAYLDRWAPAW